MLCDLQGAPPLTHVALFGLEQRLAGEKMISSVQAAPSGSPAPTFSLQALTSGFETSPGVSPAVWPLITINWILKGLKNYFRSSAGSAGPNPCSIFFAFCRPCFFLSGRLLFAATFSFSPLPFCRESFLPRLSGLFSAGFPFLRPH